MLKFLLSYSLFCSFTVFASPKIDKWSITEADEKGSLWIRQPKSHKGHKNVLRLWKHRETNRYYLRKVAKPHSIRAEAVGARLFKKFDLPVPETYLNNENPKKPTLMIEYFDGLRPISSKEDYIRNKDLFLKAMLLDILLYNYDRHKLNIRLKTNGDVVFIDHGAGLTSKAQGGPHQYPGQVTVDQVQDILSLVINKNRAVNSGYSYWVQWEELKKGRLIFSEKKQDQKKIRQAIAELEQVLTDEVIENEIISPVFSALSPKDSKSEVRSRLYSVGHFFISKVSSKFSAARSTLKEIYDDYDGNQKTFFISRLKSRRDSLVKLLKDRLTP